MSDPAIIVENLSKKYARNLRRSLVYGALDLFRPLSNNSSNQKTLRPSEFWAINNLSFELERGETLGIIGHNGAGKTTLLKLIHELVYPTSGRIEINGKIHALIALGIGFNPVLTGRENIYIAASLLGHSKREISLKFDEIVAFSELEQFIDAPVRTYSSGMNARLGFSIAISIKPEILLVDEVLAVGDLNFAIKCYRKINDFRSNGGSIILVSHSPYAIRANCNRVLWIENGKMKKIGDVKRVSDEYESYSAEIDNVDSGKNFLDDKSINNLEIEYPKTIESGSSFKLDIIINSKRVVKDAIIACSFFNIIGQNVIQNTNAESGLRIDLIKGKNQISIDYDSLILNRGSYYINIILAQEHINSQIAAQINVNKLEITSVGDLYGAGLVRLKPKWVIDKD